MTLDIGFRKGCLDKVGKDIARIITNKLLVRRCKNLARPFGGLLKSFNPLGDIITMRIDVCACGCRRCSGHCVTNRSWLQRRSNFGRFAVSCSSAHGDRGMRRVSHPPCNTGRTDTSGTEGASPSTHACHNGDTWEPGLPHVQHPNLPSCPFYRLPYWFHYSFKFLRRRILLLHCPVHIDLLGHRAEFEALLRIKQPL